MNLIHRRFILKKLKKHLKLIGLMNHLLDLNDSENETKYKF